MCEAALYLPTTIITAEVLNICKNIKVKLYEIPISNTYNKFNSDIAYTKKFGCYFIYNANNIKLGSYVGQSINLNNRIIQHALLR